MTESSGMDDVAGDQDQFDALVRLAIEAIPSPFAERLGSVAIVVEEEPAPEQLSSVGASGLFGLYQGVPRTAWGADKVPVPSKITIFRGPLVRTHRDPEALARAVADVVEHEVAHHFGISDSRLRELRSGTR
jgi:predicted Zn-dependent protease with MMP-like domain